MLALRMPETAFFSHTTAALLLRAPVPIGIERSPDLHVSVPAPARAPHASGIRGHRLDVTPGQVTVTRGVAHTSPARTWCDLASVLSLHDLVAVGDFLIHHRLPLCSLAELRRVGDAFAGRRGAALIRHALPLLSDHAESRPESILRTILELAGLPRPCVNHVIVNAEDGSHVRTDLAFDSVKLILEYQGDYHRVKSQWRSDMTRRSRLEEKGWYVMELNADDLKEPAELVTRVLSALARRGWRP